MQSGKSEMSFSFVQDRPDDLVVVARLQSSVPPLAKRVQVFYTIPARPGSFDFDVREPVYGGNYAKVIRAAVKCLLTEIKARLRDKKEFIVWFFEDDVRRAIEAVGAEIARDEPPFGKAQECLVTSAHLVSEAPVAGG